MRWSATKLRWVLLVGVLMLAGVLAGFFGLARYRAGKIWQRILARSGVNLRQETNGFTYSQSSKGRTVFTLHASKATPMGKNKWALHDAVLILYGREPGRDDRIYGKEFQYDQDEGVARAMGEVHMDLQAPEPGGKAPAAGARPNLSFEQEDEAADDPGVIHVRTSGVVYMRKMGLAATGEATEFRYGGITCTSRGAEFDSAQSVVRLLADVRMTGTVRNAPFELHATHAELNRTANTADLVTPVLASGERNARAAHALLHLRKDGSLQAAEANGGVEMHTGTRSIAAPQLTAVFGNDSRAQQARLFTGVRFADTDRARPGQGSAATLQLAWTPEGLLSDVLAEGAVRFNGNAVTADGAVQRHLAADRMQADFVPEGGTSGRRAMLHRVHLTGQAQVSSAKQPGSGVARQGSSAISGDDLLATFAPGAQGRAVIQELTGTGHTRLEQVADDGGRQQSTGDTLHVTFAPATANSSGAGASVGQGAGPTEQVSSAVQTGHVEVVSWAMSKATASPTANAGPTFDKSTGHADRAEYSGTAKTLILTAAPGGRASVQQAQGDVQAAQIVLQQTTGDAEATGGVIATNLGQNGSPATHVLANRARLLHSAGLTEFFGETGRPAQLWQGGSQVLAARITLDQRQHGMSARPAAPGEMVHAVFATDSAKDTSSSTSAKSAKGGAAAEKPHAEGMVNNTVPDAARSAVRVSATTMDYDDLHHDAVFTGTVRLSGVLGEISADRGTATLRAPQSKQDGAGASNAGPDLGGSLERMVLLGDVKLSQVGRTGVGQQLTYTAATDSFVLTGAPGKPPRVMGEQGSLVTGATLLFRNTDSTIVVAGTENGPKAPGGTRVHTETDLKQRP